MSQSKHEALEHAIAATELYIKSIRLASTPAEKSRLKGKCVDAMNRAEEIKSMERWPLFGLPSDMQGKSKKLVLQAPISTRELEAKEKLILLKSSRLHGSVFPQWTQQPSLDTFSDANGLYM